jgi:hypothetical protein
MNARAERRRILELRATSRFLPVDTDQEDRLAALRAEYYQLVEYRDPRKLERRLAEIKIAVQQIHDRMGRAPMWEEAHEQIMREHGR